MAVADAWIQETKTHDCKRWIIKIDFASKLSLKSILVFHDPDFISAVEDNEGRVVASGIIVLQVDILHAGSQQVLNKCSSVGDPVRVIGKPVEPPEDVTLVV